MSKKINMEILMYRIKKVLNEYLANPWDGIDLYEDIDALISQYFESQGIEFKSTADSNMERMARGEKSPAVLGIESEMTEEKER